jgi:5-methylcytosine-specific restriction endonuclease McrBC regulatory subunit McrC
LARHFCHVVDVAPTFARGVYRLTARGYVGTFRTANVRWLVRPKLPWDALRWLTGVGPAAGAGEPSAAEWPGRLADLLAVRLADLLRERSGAGLMCDYAEREADGTAVRGRIDLPRQLRDLGRSPGLFRLVSDEFTADVTWNRLPKAAARRLLDQPGLSAEARAALADAAAPLAAVADTTPPATELDRLRYDTRTGPYRPLVEFSRLVLGHRGPPGGPAGSALLVNLEHLFQSHVGDRLARPGALPAGWSIEPQAVVVLSSADPALAPLALRPDLFAREPDGRPVSVWDVKWKPLTAAGPDPTDVHQVLGYAAALGVRAAGLVYPGRRSAAREYSAAGSPVVLRVVRLRLAGPPAARERSEARLARLVCRT